MSEESRGLAENYVYDEGGNLPASRRLATVPAAPPIPDYLQDTYWWAYLHPRALKIFEREWIVNLILWGNMRRLTDAVLDEMKPSWRGRVLQVACVYGEFSNIVARHLEQSDSSLDIVDVAPIQLKNARRKLRERARTGFHHQDSSNLAFGADQFDDTVVFFLLHEMPEDVRRKTIAEAVRVTRPGGKVIFVDYHGPRKSNPMRYVMRPILSWLEPFALDLWRHELTEFMPDSVTPEQITSEYYFGGLYQKVIIQL
jgi:ubiquinone/menaquinone biosynthesis C-methylase UbiE